MITINELNRIASARLKDAQILMRAKRYDGAIYLCGYAIELKLKARICKTLKWPGYPANNKEFESYKSLKIHDLAVLLSFSGIERKIKIKYSTDWYTVSSWNTDVRYRLVGSFTEDEATNMLTSTENLLKIL